MAKCPCYNPLSGQCEFGLILDEPCHGEVEECDIGPDAFDMEPYYLEARIEYLENLLREHGIPFKPLED